MLDPNQVFHSMLAMNALFASLAWCLARPNRASILSVLAFAALWPFVNGRLEGRILAVISPGHGITESDLLSVLAVVAVVVQVARKTTARVSAKPPADAGRPVPVDVAAPPRPSRPRATRQPHLYPHPRPASARWSETRAASAPPADRAPTVPIPLSDPRRARVA
ncbi:hypothetical protein JDV09_08425 [Mycobacterium sp. Y57]|uniref:hypothetical protein n=1 Tax=Mycolicibacterium xanthum TaxID=2796469 RepID=UPI001C85E5D2|nr:hypothetical protein [Mycolicibacterium xanthum]MBX7432132.1 hypothetical protein [Mycolicibacterium xanthum]